ncbi:MAG: GNAT family N-acetyltransferase [Dehalococcoidia bacterium]
MQATRQINMDSTRWNEHVEDCAEGHVFHRYEWGALLSNVHGHEPVYLKHGEGIFPLALIRSRLFRTRLISLPFADYGGPCNADAEAVEQMLFSTERIALKSKADFVEIRAPGKEHFDILISKGFVRRDDYFTYLTDLNGGIDTLWKMIGEVNRSNVRKAEKNGVTLKMAENAEDLSGFYGLYLETMKKLGSPPHPYEFFQNLWELFYPAYVTIPMAMYEGKCIASGVFLLHTHKILYWFGVSTRQHLKLRPNNFLVWQMLRWGSINGYREFDFGRTREGAGNAFFKRHFGGQFKEMPYFYKIYKDGAALPQRPENKHDRISTLWAGYMPHFAARRIGPWLKAQIG